VSDQAERRICRLSPGSLQHVLELLRQVRTSIEKSTSLSRQERRRALTENARARHLVLWMGGFGVLRAAAVELKKEAEKQQRKSARGAKAAGGVSKQVHDMNVRAVRFWSAHDIASPARIIKGKETRDRVRAAANSLTNPRSRTDAAKKIAPVVKLSFHTTLTMLKQMGLFSRRNQRHPPRR